MDLDLEDRWESDSTASDEELEGDEVENGLKDKSSDHAKRYEKEVDNWTTLIAIVTGDSVIQGTSPFCTCNKSTRSIPTISLSAGILCYSISLMIQDISRQILKYASTAALFVMVCSVSSVRDIILHLPSDLILRSTRMSFSFSTECI